jgi:hypothetical protein
MLPSVIKGARIWVFDYNSNYSHDAQTVRIGGLAATLLNCIKDRHDDFESRKCIFIILCFGSIVVAYIISNDTFSCENPLPENIPDYEYRGGEHMPPGEKRPPISADDFQCLLNFCPRTCWWARIPWHLCNPPSDELTLLERVPEEQTLWGVQTKGHGYAWGLECKLEHSFVHNLMYHVVIFAGGFAFWGWWGYRDSIYPDDLRIKSLPTSVENAYERILGKINERQKTLLVKSCSLLLVRDAR